MAYHAQYFLYTGVQSWLLCEDLEDMMTNQFAFIESDMYFAGLLVNNDVYSTRLGPLFGDRLFQTIADFLFRPRYLRSALPLAARHYLRIEMFIFLQGINRCRSDGISSRKSGRSPDRWDAHPHTHTRTPWLHRAVRAGRQPRTLPQQLLEVRALCKRGHGCCCSRRSSPDLSCRRQRCCPTRSRTCVRGAACCS